MSLNDQGPHVGIDEMAKLSGREPPPFLPDDMRWYDDMDGRPLAGYLELVLAAKAAHYGSHGLFVHWNVRNGMFTWYANTEAGWENRNRDLEGLLPTSKKPLPDGPRRRIASAADMVGFCRFVISQLLHPISEFDSAAANDPDFWLSHTNGNRCALCRKYDAAALMADVYRICTCILPADKVPFMPDGSTVQHLRAFLDRVQFECLKCDGGRATEDPAPVPLKPLMTAPQIAVIVSHVMGKPVAPKTLTESGILGDAASPSKGGRGNMNQWNYDTVRPQLKAKYGSEFPNLSGAWAIISNPR